MKQFAALFLQLDQTNKTNAKVQLLKDYFLHAPDEDKIWALALFSGRRPSFKVNRNQVRLWAYDMAQIPEWLFNEAYHSVGDLGETISLVLPEPTQTYQSKTLAEWFIYLSALPKATDEEKKHLVVNAWTQLPQQEQLVFNKLMMGSFRVGVSQTLVTRALAEAYNLDASAVAHRLMGSWLPSNTSFNELIFQSNTNDEASKPYPFYLAYAIEGVVNNLGDVNDWQVEWKWDGIRAQIIVRNNDIFIWTRGEELATDKFPELHVLKELLPNGTVIDGELLAFKDGKPLPFNLLQTRITRKNITKKIQETTPIGFIAYDVLEHQAKDIRNESMLQRRMILQQLFQTFQQPHIITSPIVEVQTWDELMALHAQSRHMQAEGFMLKHKQSVYIVGRKKGDWWKWKVDPLSVDAVLIYAQKGHGRRTEFYTDYTFAVWGDDGKLVPFAKAYSGLTDEEIRQVDYFVKRNTIEKFGPVRTVKPELVFEIGFEGINTSTRHKARIAVRFPRILRWRKDKKAEEADHLSALNQLLQQVQ